MSTFTDSTHSTGTPDSDASSDSAGFTRPPFGPDFSRRPPLRRAYQGRMVAGVAAGIADYLAVDVTIVRVIFAALTFLGGAAIPAYLACLLLIPEEGSDESIAAALLDSVQHRTR
jgi:phage shock protein C